MRITIAAALLAGAAAVVTTASAASAASAATPTSHHAVRPVTSTGHVVAGWTVTRGAGSIDCSAAMPSPAAVDPDILYCSPSAAFAIACWKGSDGVHALCLTDAVHHKLIRYVVDGAFPHAAKPADPVPFRMTLGDGTACKIRDGGAGAPLAGHPNWTAFYYCVGGLSVWEPDSGDGLNRAHAEWTVQVAPSDGHTAPETRRVAAATFVGTA